MSLTPLLFLKKPFQDIKEKKEIKDLDFQAPLQVEKDKKQENRSLDLLLELCRQGLVSKLSKEKILFSEELEETEEVISSESSPFILCSSLPPLPPPSPILDFTPQISSISTIPEECLKIIDKLCSEMLVMDAESCITTTFILETDAFINSPFFGAKVTIEEYCTAPKVFNVSITAQESAITLLESQMTGFFQLLETRNFSFSIHKIDTHLSTDSWYKEKEQGHDQDKQDKEDE
ncbi:MAG: hypothetical protein V4489_05805 [Chlamydiota bacterium]